MKKILVDTNPILRFFLNDNRKQKEAFEKLLLQAKESKIKLIIPQIIIFELQFALEKYYLMDKLEIIDKLKVLLSTDYIEIESREYLILAISLYSNSNISLVDCFLIVQTQDKGADIFTFDQKLNKLAKKY